MNNVNFVFNHDEQEIIEIEIVKADNGTLGLREAYAMVTDQDTFFDGYESIEEMEIDLIRYNVTLYYEGKMYGSEKEIVNEWENEEW